VLGGVIASTLLGVFFVPLFFVLIRGRMGKRADRAVPFPKVSAHG